MLLRRRITRYLPVRVERTMLREITLRYVQITMWHSHTHIYTYIYRNDAQCCCTWVMRRACPVAFNRVDESCLGFGKQLEKGNRSYAIVTSRLFINNQSLFLFFTAIHLFISPSFILFYFSFSTSPPSFQRTRLSLLLLWLSKFDRIASHGGRNPGKCRELRISSIFVFLYNVLSTFNYGFLSLS